MAAGLGSALVVAPGCGRLQRHLLGGKTPTRTGTITVSPASGPTGTAFSLTAVGFRPGEPMTFNFDLPDHTHYVGPSHTAGPDGKVTATYTPRRTNPPGPYQVKAVGSRGTRARTTLVITGSPSPPTT